MVEHQRKTTTEPLDRLLHDLAAFGQMQRNDRASASERVMQALGPGLLEVFRRAIVAPERVDSGRAA